MPITEKPKQIKRNFVQKASWLSVRKKASEQKCANCKPPFSETKEDFVGLGMFEGIKNQQLCTPCCEHFISLGGEDIDKLVIDKATQKENLITNILARSTYYVRKGSYGGYRDLEKKDIAKLQDIMEQLDMQDQAYAELQAKIAAEYVETPTEKYLVDDYNLHEFADLKHESQIPDWFKNDFNDEFDCGQGYYEDKAVLFVKIGAKFYHVTLTAEIGSAKQNVGDRLYWVEGIKKVEYVEVEKPAPKNQYTYIFSMNLSGADFTQVEHFLKGMGVSFDVKKL